MSARRPTLRPRRVAAPRDHGDDAGLADAGVMLDAERGELLLHDARGAMLLEAELGMRVEVTANGGEFVVPAADVVGGVHGDARFQWSAAALRSMRRRGSTA